MLHALRQAGCWLTLMRAAPAQLPFREDVRDADFASFDKLPPPTRAQLDAMDALLDAMDLTKGGWCMRSGSGFGQWVCLLPTRAMVPGV